MPKTPESEPRQAAITARTQQPGLLRFLTCGSVDDGKSTLIGRLLHDASLVPEDQLAALTSSLPPGAGGGHGIEFALLLDGLLSEREQGITIDVAYRYFATARRTFVVADTPGHEQYTRNMVTGASGADLAILLVDARKGFLPQTHRHSSIVHLLGIRDVVLVVNKMDLVGFAQARFGSIAADYGTFARKLGLGSVVCIPVVARDGDNVVRRSARMAWYDGPCLLEYLEAAEPRVRDQGRSFRMPVQWVGRDGQDFRGFAGMIASGEVRGGDPIIVLPSRRSTTVKEVLDGNGVVESAGTGRSIMLRLADEVDVARGDVLAARSDPPEVVDQVAADIIWLGDEAMLPGRPYLAKCGTQTVNASISRLRYKLSFDSLEQAPGSRLELNEIGHCNVTFSNSIAVEPYAADRTLGSFILIDKASAATVGAGLIKFGLRRATNLRPQLLDVDRAAREAIMGQQARCLWFTGLSGAGKSTIANLLEQRLHMAERFTYVIDGDNVRHGLNKDLGFTDADRVENIRRVAEVARLMVDAGLIVLVSLISPFRSERQMARELFAPGEFAEFHVDTPLDVCEARDPKGLYKKARAGLIPNFTGIGSSYEAPVAPELRLDAAEESPEALVERILRFLDPS